MKVGTQQMTTEELTRLGGEVTVDGVARLLVGEILHGLKRRRTCGRTKAIYIIRTITSSHFHVVLLILVCHNKHEGQCKPD